MHEYVFLEIGEDIVGEVSICADGRLVITNDGSENARSTAAHIVFRFEASEKMPSGRLEIMLR